MPQEIHTGERMESLSVPLNDDQVRSKLNELSRNSLRLETLLEDRREVMGRFNTDIKAARGIIKALAQATNTGMGAELVRVQTVKNFAEGTLVRTRLDTGEVVEGPRPMSADEAQMEMVGDDDPEGVPGKPKRGRPKGSGKKAPPEPVEDQHEPPHFDAHGEPLPEMGA
jgi:hypothetical protein